MATYSEQLAELEQIVATLQDNQVDIDQMVTLTRRATELITTLRERLTATDTQLKEILATLQPPA